MDAFSSLLSDLPKEDASLIQGLQEYRQGQMSALRQQREAQTINAYKAKAESLNALKSQYEQIPEDVRKADFPAIKHDMNSAANRIEFNHQMSLIDPQDPSKDFKLSTLKERFPEKERTNFIDTPLYKSAESDWKVNRERYDITNALGDQLIEMRAFLNEGTPEAKVKATSVAKEGIMKTVNSLQGKDAVSLGEQLTRFQDILTLSDIGQQLNKAPTDWALWANRLLGAKTEDRKGPLLDQARQMMAAAFEANPEAFYETTSKLYNANANTSNNNAKRVENMTSPYHREMMQANYIENMADREARIFGASRNRPPVPAPSSSSPQIPVSSGSTQMGQPPAGAGNALLEEMRKRGLKPQ